ncbi:hypothetical protein GALMADRAFT_223161 [Galerina marginata CBS 339.88]|uniref:Uncharacterized protein n=1 Tax=Galerina marginata (strain CBS 339.88) TaxID=685588 RepID=A0A067TMS4_GALM3|nr:hypothetical protein GALMADRAFT_223161 [Galerina marginata CBS 339.88]
MSQMSPNLHSWGPTRTFLTVGSLVAAGLGGFYLSMSYRKRLQELSGRTPHYEQIMGHAIKTPAAYETLPVLNARYSDIPPAFPGKDHHSGHNTLGTFRQSPDYAESGDSLRYMVPPPQRGKADGSGRAYTKSPDYADNYNKTARPRPLDKEPTANA